ncbi:MAG: hypothetical protein L0Z73_20305 [Gammaproteobacteria bacterium]|nr:hypothetical protein [Gammaproteobacteria bacterium]
MVGKKNVVFGFLFLVITAALGPWMITKYSPGEADAQAEKQNFVGRLQSLKADNFEENLEPLPPEELAKANTDGILALNKLVNARQPIDLIRSGPHVHGNLEALLNIVVGIALCFIAVGRKFKEAISWIFILGTLLHSGILFIAVMLDQTWAFSVLGTGIGPVLILLGLLLAGVAAAMGLRAEVVKD